MKAGSFEPACSMNHLIKSGSAEESNRSSMVSARNCFKPISLIFGIHVGAWLFLRPGVDPKRASDLPLSGWFIASWCDTYPPAELPTMCTIGSDQVKQRQGIGHQQRK